MDSTQKLQSAAQAVSTATMVLRMELPTIEAFLKEAADLENFGHILNPTLYRDPERLAVNALMVPLFKQALQLVRTYDDHVAKATDALAKVEG